MALAKHETTYGKTSRSLQLQVIGQMQEGTTSLVPSTLFPLHLAPSGKGTEVTDNMCE